MAATPNEARQILGIKFAPFRLPLERRLQTSSVAFFITSLIFAMFFTIPLLTYTLIFTKFWYIPMLYAAWIFYDRNTPYQGGRKYVSIRLFYMYLPLKAFVMSHFGVISFGLTGNEAYKYNVHAIWYALRNLSMWVYYRDYFPVGLVKTAELPSNKNYIFAVYPHGIMSVAAFLNFQSNANHFDKLYPGIDPHIVVLNANFRVPIAKDIFLACGGIAASEQSIINCLQSKPGASCVMMPGGASEALLSFPERCNIILKNRRGFIRLAIKTGASVVPVFSFGENEIFDQITGKWLLWVQQKLKIILGLAPCLLKGRGFFQYSFGLLPHRRPIVTVVGKPIDIPKNPNPSTELITEFHQKYEDGLIQLFNEYKSKYHPLGNKAVLQIE